VSLGTVARIRMLRLWAPGLVIWGLALAYVTPAGAGVELLDGCRWLRDGRPDLGIRCFETALAEDGECAVALAGRGVARLLTGRLDEAEQDFRDAVALKPTLPSAHLGLGAACCLAGDFEGALQAYRYVVALPLESRASLRAAMAYASCATGLYASGQQEAQAALDQEPDNELAAYVLAASLLAQGQVAQGLSALEAAKPSTGRLGITVPSCLFATNTRYWVDRGGGCSGGSGSAVASGSPAGGSSYPQPLAGVGSARVDAGTGAAWA